MEDHETLISVESLSAELENPSLQVVDCRFNLLQPDAGRAAYENAHIPGAAYAHLDVSAIADDEPVVFLRWTMGETI